MAGIFSHANNFRATTWVPAASRIVHFRDDMGGLHHVDYLTFLIACLAVSSLKFWRLASNFSPFSIILTHMFPRHFFLGD